MAARYILLPRRGLRPFDGPGRLALGSIFEVANRVGMGMAARFAALSNRSMTVLDAMPEGPMLVMLDEETADLLNRIPGPMRAVPEVIFPLPSDHVSALSVPAEDDTVAFTVRCVDGRTGAGLPARKVVAVGSNRSRSAMTDLSGAAELRLPPGTIDRLEVQPPAGYWGGYRANIPVADTTVTLEPVAIDYRDAVRTLYPASRFVPETGVQVGVLDSGVGPHNEINLVGGECTVMGARPDDYVDIAGHGTHVSGLIGGLGRSGTGVRGLAPGVRIFGYRVFGRGDGNVGGSHYALMKAIIHAHDQRIDILNLSLGGQAGDVPDTAVEESIADARAHGMLVVVAAGNAGRLPVAYPAAYPGATAVSAMGRKGTFPSGSSDEACVLHPPYNANETDDFMAAFSCKGREIKCVGLGVGILSTLPYNKFGPMSGTSVAAPMVTGCAASLLSQDLRVFSMARNRDRAKAIETLLLNSCVKRFNDPEFEGYGLPDPARV